MSDLNKAATLVSEWRRSKRYAGERMPIELWDLACRLAGIHPIHVVANELKITGTELRRQLAKRRHIETELTTQKTDVRSFPPAKAGVVPPQFIAEIFIQPNMIIRINSAIAEKDLKTILAMAREVA
jgi:hypothetical protein